MQPKSPRKRAGKNLAGSEEAGSRGERALTVVSGADFTEIASLLPLPPVGRDIGSGFPGARQKPDSVVNLTSPDFHKQPIKAYLCSK